jgi:hypothetical protein
MDHFFTDQVSASSEPPYYGGAVVDVSLCGSDSDPYVDIYFEQKKIYSFQFLFINDIFVLVSY